LPRNLKEERTGMIRKNTYGSLMEVIEYNNSHDILVKFDRGKPVHTQWNPFLIGEVRNVYDKTVCGVGYIGEGRYVAKINGKHTPQYEKWASMMKRCYSEKLHNNQPTYLICTVAEEWHNFQTFAAWHDENYYEAGEGRMCLDKDILVKGNKIYSPETCIFVHERINNLFIKRKGERGKFPIGVSWNNWHEKFIVQCNDVDGYASKLGYYGTTDEAFQAYKTFKEKVIKQVAEDYKEKIPNKLYEALMKYQVEITD
jgi:hypothetical protein